MLTPRWRESKESLLWVSMSLWMRRFLRIKDWRVVKWIMEEILTQTWLPREINLNPCLHRSNHLYQTWAELYMRITRIIRQALNQSLQVKSWALTIKCKVICNSKPKSMQLSLGIYLHLIPIRLRTQDRKQQLFTMNSSIIQLAQIFRILWTLRSTSTLVDWIKVINFSLVVKASPPLRIREKAIYRATASANPQL